MSDIPELYSLKLLKKGLMHIKLMPASEDVGQLLSQAVIVICADDYHYSKLDEEKSVFPERMHWLGHVTLVNLIDGSLPEPAIGYESLSVGV